MKKWLCLTCPVCGFRYQLKKFSPAMRPISYPLQVVTGGGRAKGFIVDKYMPWSDLPTLRRTEAWSSLLCLYSRLGTAYDHFYEVLGFLSPEIRRLLLEVQKSYTDVYQKGAFSDYAKTYAPIEPSIDIAEPYREDDYSGAYAHFLTNHVPVGACVE